VKKSRLTFWNDKQNLDTKTESTKQLKELESTKVRVGIGKKGNKSITCSDFGPVSIVDPRYSIKFLASLKQSTL